MNPPLKLIFVKNGIRQEFIGPDAQSIISDFPFAYTAFENLKAGGWIEAHGGRYTLEVEAKQV